MARKYLVVRDKHFPTKQLIDNPQKGTASWGGGGGGGEETGRGIPDKLAGISNGPSGQRLFVDEQSSRIPSVRIVCECFLFLFFISPRIGGPTIIPVLAGENRRHFPLRLLRRECRVRRTRRVGSLIYRRARARSPPEDRPGCCWIVSTPDRNSRLNSRHSSRRAERMAYRLRSFTSSTRPSIARHSRRICARNNYNNVYPNPARSIRRRARRYITAGRAKFLEHGSWQSPKSTTIPGHFGRTPDTHKQLRATSKTIIIVIKGLAALCGDRWWSSDCDRHDGQFVEFRCVCNCYCSSRDSSPATLTEW